MTVTIHADVIQGSDEWMEARRGILTASEMCRIVTPTLKAASNDKEKTHLYELLAQRINEHVEPTYIGDAMLRGRDEEIDARLLYEKTYATVTECGFITNDRWGFTLGYSPDGLVGDDGAIECKSRVQKYQTQTLIENVPANTVPADFIIQVQTGLLVSERDWIDFISYSNGMPMITIRAYPDDKIQTAILDAATAFEERLADKLATYRAALASDARLIPTERKITQEMF